MSATVTRNSIRPLDLAFLLMEKPNRPMHMCAFMVFESPRGARGFARGVVNAFRCSDIAQPFNQVIRRNRLGGAALESVDVDLNYHVRHIALPSPGKMEDCFELVARLNMPLLDRAKPLWECYVIEGIAKNRFAVMLKLHHAIADGESGLRMFRQSLSDSADDAELRPVWAPVSDAGKQSKRRKPKQPKSKAPIARLSELQKQLRASAEAIGAELKSFTTSDRAIPFAAQPTIFNKIATSSDRRYGNCEFQLADVKAISNATGTTINDVMMTLIDGAMNRYCEQQGTPLKRPLVAMMAMSLRAAGDEGGGNKAGLQLVSLGQPAATGHERLQQIAAATADIKAAAGNTPASLLNLYTLLLTGGATLSDSVPVLTKVPSANLVISNMVGPREQLYLGGAPMVGFHGLPILPPGAGVNVTFASLNQTLGLAIAAAPEAIAEPQRLAELVHEEFKSLQRAAQNKEALS